MIMNNLDPKVDGQVAGLVHHPLLTLRAQVAQYPHELVTYGGNGSVFSNW